jgi:hypothetical protein
LNFLADFSYFPTITRIACLRLDLPFPSLALLQVESLGQRILEVDVPGKICGISGMTE